MSQGKKKRKGANGSAPKKRKHSIGHVFRRVGQYRPGTRKHLDVLDRFGPYLMGRRQAQLLTVRQFALRAGMPHSNIFQFEKLRKNPRLTELAKLAEALEEPLTKFLEPLQSIPKAINQEPVVEVPQEPLSEIREATA